MPDPRDISILELASTQELLDELHRRSSLFVFIVVPLVKDPDDKFDFTYGCSSEGGKTTKGAVIRGLGYMELAKRLFLDKCEDNDANPE